MIFLAVLLGMLLAVILTAPPGQRQQVPELKRNGHRDRIRGCSVSGCLPGISIGS